MKRQRLDQLRLLLPLLGALQACSCAPDTPRSEVPSQLVRVWGSSSGSGSGYYDPGSGSYGAPNSSQFRYQFYSDGSYEHAALLQSSLYNCTMKVFGYERGTVVFTSSTVTVYPLEATLRSEDNCVAENNYEKPGDKSVVQYTWRMGTDPVDGATTLILTWPNGFEEVFRPM